MDVSVGVGQVRQGKQLFADANMYVHDSRGIRAACFCALLLFASPAPALEPIETDGPDFVESSEVVPKGRFQYEIDMTSVHDRRATPHNTILSTPTLLKYGAAENIEIRIAPAGYIRGNDKSGWGATALGIKWHARDSDAAQGMPAVSWILHLDTPTGSSQFLQDGIRPSLRSVITWQLPQELAFGLMPGIEYGTRPDGGRFTSAILGAVLNARLNARIRGFMEFSAPEIAHAQDGGVIATWNLGAAYLVNNDLQLGVRVGVAANQNTPNNYLLFELAQRF
jgi:Putative MetA-pathway of phenol degradation